MNNNEYNALNIYKFNEHMLDKVSPKFFDMENLSMLRTGIYGYLNELYSTISEANAHSISELSNEFLPYSSKITSNVFKYASFVKYSEFNAQPAVVPLSISISQTNLLEKSIQYEGYREFILDKNTQIQIGRYFYMFDYDIIITMKDTVKGIIYNTQFDINDSNPKDLNKFINNMVVEESTDKYLYLILDCYQSRRERFEKTLTTDNVVDLTGFDLEFQGELFRFDIYYKGPNETVYEKLELILENGPPIKEKFCYYHYIKEESESTLKISFSGLPGYFMPNTGGDFIVDIYTTEGLAGNFKYTGNETKIIVTNERFNYDDVTFFINVLGDSKHGKASKTLEEIKSVTSSLMTTVNSINTDNDLNEYFKDRLNNHISFTKKRDDILKRSYNGFVKMYFDDMLISANSMNMEILSGDLTTEGRVKVIENNREYVYVDNMTTNNVRFKTELDEDAFVFMNPFVHLIDIEHSLCSTFMVNVNEDIRMAPNFINREGFIQPIYSQISVQRDGIGDDSYNIECAMKLSNVEGLSVGELTSSGELKFIMSLPDKYYVEFDVVNILDDVVYLQCNLETNNVITNEGKIHIVDTLYKGGILQPDVSIDMSDLQIEIMTFYKTADTIESFPLEFKDKLDDPSFDGSILTNVYKNITPLNLVINLTSVITIGLKYSRPQPNGDYYIELTNIPMIKNSYAQDVKLLNRICDKFYEYKETLGEVKAKLDNADLELKFLNTYGRSRSFKLADGSTMSSNNIKLSFDVKLNYYNGVNITQLKYEIQQFVARYIASVNNSKTGEYSIYISNLIKGLENKISNIKYLIYNGINNYGPEVQSIHYKSPEITEVPYDMLHNLIPEFFNVEYIWDAENERYAPDVDINFI